MSENSNSVKNPLIYNEEIGVNCKCNSRFMDENSNKNGAESHKPLVFGRSEGVESVVISFGGNIHTCEKTRWGQFSDRAEKSLWWGKPRWGMDILAYFPFLVVLGCIAGYFTGMCAEQLLGRLGPELAGLKNK